jgi:hypothetical protein
MAKCAESISKGALKMKVDDGGKLFIFEYLDKHVAIEMKLLKLHGLKYLNDILIDDILTKCELDEVYAILNQVQATLLTKADQEEVDQVQATLLSKADQEEVDQIRNQLANHTHTSFNNINVNTINNIPIALKSASSHILTGRPVIPVVKEDGVIEVGKYIDMHDHGEEGDDYTVRLTAMPGMLISSTRITASNLKADNETRLRSVESGKANVDHTHVVSDITDLHDSLDSKANVEHTHVANDITDMHIVYASYNVVNHSLQSTIQFSSSSIHYPASTATRVDDQHIEVVLYLDDYTNDVNTSIRDDHGYVKYITINNAFCQPRPEYYYNCYMIEATIDLSLYTVYDNSLPVLSEAKLYVEHDLQESLCSLTYAKTPMNKPGILDILTFNAMVDILHPVGSIYTSMNNINPATLFGGTWQQIVDRFLYATDGASLQTGGSKKISTAQLPAHDHGFRDYTFTWHWGRTYAEPYHVHAMATCADGASNDNYIHTQPDTHNRTATTGSGADYMPPYMTVYAWYRVA